MLKRLYTIAGLLIVLGYGWVSWRGLEAGQTKRGFAPQGVRGTHGGTRPLWYGGYRGGK